MTRKKRRKKNLHHNLFVGTFVITPVSHTNYRKKSKVLPVGSMQGCKHKCYLKKKKFTIKKMHVDRNVH